MQECTRYLVNYIRFVGLTLCVACPLHNKVGTRMGRDKDKDKHKDKESSFRVGVSFRAISLCLILNQVLVALHVNPSTSLIPSYQPHLLHNLFQMF